MREIASVLYPVLLLPFDITGHYMRGVEKDREHQEFDDMMFHQLMLEETWRGKYVTRGMYQTNALCNSTQRISYML